MILEHSLPVGVLQCLLADSVTVLLESQDFIVRELRYQLGREIVAKVEIQLFFNVLLSVCIRGAGMVVSA